MPKQDVMKIEIRVPRSSGVKPHVFFRDVIHALAQYADEDLDENVLSGRIDVNSGTATIRITEEEAAA